MEQQVNSYYSKVIQSIKSAILKSRYRAAALANRELLSLYYGIGKYISENSRNHFWGTNAIETISIQLQQELPGLRGFSKSNIKNMRQFYEAWEQIIVNCQPTTGENRLLITDEIETDILTSNRQLVTGDLKNSNIDSLLSIGFTHHCEILAKTDSLEERLFYIQHCATEFWSVEKLKYNLKSNLYTKQGKLPNNFKTTISDIDLQRKALLSFKDEYLLDYINIESPDDEPDERVLESAIVSNIRKFIMSLGRDFSFIGNQHRVIVEEREYFIDLLFFNRQLQCLIAIELKRGDFKPEYLGKMNFYLSALDDLVRLPHENRSIGIILCKSQRQKTVEYAFRDMTKPMGVATYTTGMELPDEYKNILPDAEELKQLL
ncbi:MAG: PDDEXK nuclease domain-containing protein [Holosporales bacterium]|jgi:predicted nuclease of restriction endonuclease-like (RecB) superfamily|nr:PDDEXK nuclease domain-containing protein [Holosporales bacterium]